MRSWDEDANSSKTWSPPPPRSHPASSPTHKTQGRVCFGRTFRITQQRSLASVWRHGTVYSGWINHLGRLFPRQQQLYHGIIIYLAICQINFSAHVMLTRAPQRWPSFVSRLTLLHSGRSALWPGLAFIWFYNTDDDETRDTYTCFIADIKSGDGAAFDFQSNLCKARTEEEEKTKQLSV